MIPEQDILDFIRATFGSVWALELLLLLATEPERNWSQRELVGKLRASDLVVKQATDELTAASLVAVRDRQIRYVPGSPLLDKMTAMMRGLYARSPDMVRRTIVEAMR